MHTLEVEHAIVGTSSPSIWPSTRQGAFEWINAGSRKRLIGSGL